MTDIPPISVYPVGLAHDLARWAGNPDRSEARRRLRYDLRYFAAKLRHRQWRSARSYLNGWLAEPTDWPEGLTRCGSGWTRGRALRDLQRRIAAATPEEPTP